MSKNKALVIQNQNYKLEGVMLESGIYRPRVKAYIVGTKYTEHKGGLAMVTQVFQLPPCYHVLNITNSEGLEYVGK